MAICAIITTIYLCSIVDQTEGNSSIIERHAKQRGFLQKCLQNDL